MREGRREHRGHHHDEHREGKGRRPEDKKHFRSAQTFRRGRALAFLERLNIRRTTLLTQLGQPEYESIRQVISGELKATDTIIQEFIHMFELQEIEEENGHTKSDQLPGENTRRSDKEDSRGADEQTGPGGKEA
ncbi:hypothetical protein [Paenibacillus wulumuqiensis]|uniref:hypothetical protein n=1 Tax=Paenibacillus wulumuqiensis TaxID=1567107 RepID=UPI0006195374|nr:hypothetical protein [Paenibacillus wulumuqiensis]